MFQKIVKLCVYLLVFLMPLFWLPFSLEAYDINKAYLLVFLVGLGVLAWLGRMVFNDKKIIFKRTPLDFFVLGYLAVVVLTAVFARDKVSSWVGLYGRFWPSLMTTAGLVGFYFLVTNNTEISKFRDGEISRGRDGEKGEISKYRDGEISRGQDGENGGEINLPKVLNLFFTSCFIAVGAAYFSLLNLWVKIAGLLNFKLPVLMQTRSFSTVGSLQGLAVFLAAVLAMLLVYLAFQSRVYEKPLETKGGKRKSGMSGQVAWYILSFAIVGLLAIINFRQAWLCLALSLGLFLALSFWKRMFREDVQRLSLPIFLLLIAVVFLFPNPLTKFLNQSAVINNLPKEILLSSNESWQTAFNGLKENPVLGSGVSNFHYSFAKFKPASFLSSQFWQARFDRAGNNMAETLATTGVLGLLVFAILFAMYFLISYLYIKAANKEKTGGFGESAKRFLAVPENPASLKAAALFARHIPILAGFTALLIAQFCYYQTAVLGFSFWLMLSLGVVSWGKGAKEKKFLFKDFPEVGLLLSIVFWVALLALAFLYFTLLRYYSADMQYRAYLAGSGQDIAKLEKAAQSNSFGPTFHMALASAYMQKFYNEAQKETPSKEIVANAASLAIQESRKAVALGPNRVAVYEISGVIYRDIQGVAQGALEWATKSFESALKLEPLNPAIITELGKIKLTAKDKDGAKQLFEKATNIKKDYVESSLQLVLLDEAEGKQSDALTKLENLVKSAPFSVEARFWLARNYYNSRDYDKAFLQVEQALILFPNHSNSLFLLGLIYDKQGKTDLALQAMEKVLELNPNSQEVKDQISRIKKPAVIETPKEEK